MIMWTFFVPQKRRQVPTMWLCKTDFCAHNMISTHTLTHTHTLLFVLHPHLLCCSSLQQLQDFQHLLHSWPGSTDSNEKSCCCPLVTPPHPLPLLYPYTNSHTHTSTRAQHHFTAAGITSTDLWCHPNPHLCRFTLLNRQIKGGWKARSCILAFA